MPRPCKMRRIGFSPHVKAFKPVGVPGAQLDVIQLNIDELEAIRLADYEGLYQEEAAQKMQISRQTFGNIINSAHKKISQCLIDGKMLSIEEN